MDDNLITNVSEEGLLIPKAWLAGVDRVEIYKKNDVITIRPIVKPETAQPQTSNSWNGDPAADVVGICSSETDDGSIHHDRDIYGL